MADRYSVPTPLSPIKATFSRFKEYSESYKDALIVNDPLEQEQDEHRDEEVVPGG